MKNNNIPL